jgi:hypothetical protein
MIHKKYTEAQGEMEVKRLVGAVASASATGAGVVAAPVPAAG